MALKWRIYSRKLPVYQLRCVFCQISVSHSLNFLQNAFVTRLGSTFNPSKMLVVDLLHEFELGVWKSLFTHLIRLLYSADKGSDTLVMELDARLVKDIYSRVLLLTNSSL